MHILTHECADAASWDMGQCQEHLKPVRPMLMFGRSARLPPQCPVEHSVWYGWRESRALFATLRPPLESPPMPPTLDPERTSRASACTELVSAADLDDVASALFMSVLSLYACDSQPFHPHPPRNSSPSNKPPPPLRPHPTPWSLPASLRVCSGGQILSSVLPCTILLTPMSSLCSCCGGYTLWNVCIECRQLSASREFHMLFSTKSCRALRRSRNACRW